MRLEAKPGSGRRSKKNYSTAIFILQGMQSKNARDRLAKHNVRVLSDILQNACRKIGRARFG